jgi:hypothetical protein
MKSEFDSSFSSSPAGSSISSPCTIYPFSSQSSISRTDSLSECDFENDDVFSVTSPTGKLDLSLSVCFHQMLRVELNVKIPRRHLIHAYDCVLCHWPLTCEFSLFFPQELDFFHVVEICCISFLITVVYIKN